MKASAIALCAVALATAGAVYAQTTPQVPYTARAFNPAHADLARSAGVPARLANEAYVEALARIVYYWGYPAVDQFGRHGMWEMLKSGPGLMFGILPGGPMNTSACLTDYLPPSQRFVVSPNNDTFYGIGFANLGQEPAVIQTPTNAPQGHYWTVQIVDAFSNVIHQIGSASQTPGGKFLLVGPDWKGQKPDGFLDILRVPTNYAGAFGRSFAARTPEAKARALAVLNQLGMYPLSKNQAGRHNFDCAAAAHNTFYPPGVTAEMLVADPDVARPEWVVPTKFWDDLKKVLTANPTVGAGDIAPWPTRRGRWWRSMTPVQPGKRSSIARRSQPTPRFTTAASITRWASSPATAGSGRRTVACGGPTGSAGRWRPRSTSTSTTTARQCT
jgi:hypothetical protein